MNVSLDDLVALSAANPVRGFAIGLDDQRTGAFLKLRCGNRDHLFWLPINTANQFGSAGTDGMQRKGWRSDGPNSQPTIKAEDWGNANDRCVGPTLFHVFDDAAIICIALLSEPDTFTAFRVPAHLAASISELLLEQFPTPVHKGSGSVH